MKTKATANFRSGYVAIIGKPNAGKSTLLNTFLREKISIVTPKPQTTRQRIIGIYNDDTTQIIFHDTPGLIKPSYLLQSHMMKAVLAASKDADLVLVLHDGTEGESLPALVLDQLPRLSRARKFLVINKTDELSKAQHQKLERSFASSLRDRTFDNIFFVSALKELGTEELLAAIKEAMPIHPPYYPEDILSEHPEKFFAAEFIREAIFLHYGQEIPYSSAVEIIDYKEREKGKTYIAANILVERESQKKIVIGKGGSALKKTGQHARKQIEQFIGAPVFLELFVKTAEQWRSKESSLQWLGYTAPGEQ